MQTAPAYCNKDSIAWRQAQESWKKGEPERAMIFALAAIESSRKPSKTEVRELVNDLWERTEYVAG